MKTIAYFFIVALLLGCNNNEKLIPVRTEKWKLQQTKVDEIFSSARAEKNIDWSKNNVVCWKKKINLVEAEFSTFPYYTSNIQNVDSVKFINNNDTLSLYRMFTTITASGEPVFSYWFTDLGVMAEMEINKVYPDMGKQDTVRFDKFLQKLKH